MVRDKRHTKAAMGVIKLDRPARNVREIPLTCVPKGLQPEDLERFFVDTSAGRSPRQHFRENLKAKLEQADRQSILVYGHRGCGKSSELVRLRKDFGDKYFCVGFSINDEMNLAAIYPEDIIVVIVERLLQTAADAGLKIKEAYLEDIERFLAEEILTEKEARSHGVSVEGGGEASSGPLAGILKLLVKAKGDIKYQASAENTYASKVRKRPADLLIHANNAIAAVRDVLGERNQELLIIVEDLDKISIANARRVFIENGKLLAQLETRVIYTIPIFLVHAPDAGGLYSDFSDDIQFPMIKITDYSGERMAGFDLVREIIHRRIEPGVIAPDAIDLLIEKTGGVLQHVFQVLNTIPTLSGLADPVSVEDMRYALDLRRAKFYKEITLPKTPLDDLDDVDQLYDRLAEYAKIQSKGERIIPKTETVNEVLLSSAAIVEYNRESCFMVHPLVVEILEELKRI